MSNILKQRHLLTKRYFEITNAGLKITVKKPFNFFEEEFSFEDIVKRTSRKRSPNRVISIIGIIAIIGFLITFIGKIGGDKTIGWDDITFYVVLIVVMAFLFWITFKNEINLMLVDRRYIVFIAYAPGKITVQEFINLIFSEQKQFLLNKYAQPGPYLSQEQLTINLKWLLDKDIIDETELEELNSKLFKPNTANPIGFKFNSSIN